MKDLTISYKIGECTHSMYHCEESINRFTDTLTDLIINSGFSTIQILHLLESNLGYETY